jgi:hypothetical protein
MDGGRFSRSYHLRPDSAKSYGNSVRRITYRNTDEFSVLVTAALIGRFTAFPEKG